MQISYRVYSLLLVMFLVIPWFKLPGIESTRSSAILLLSFGLPPPCWGVVWPSSGLLGVRPIGYRPIFSLSGNLFSHLWAISGNPNFFPIRPNTYCYAKFLLRAAQSGLQNELIKNQIIIILDCIELWNPNHHYDLNFDPHAKIYPARPPIPILSPNRRSRWVSLPPSIILPLLGKYASLIGDLPLSHADFKLVLYTEESLL